MGWIAYGMVNGMVFYSQCCEGSIARRAAGVSTFAMRPPKPIANPVANPVTNPSRRSAWPTHPLCMTVCAAILNLDARASRRLARPSDADRFA